MCPDFPDSVVCAALAGVGGAGVDRGTCWSVGTCRGDNRGGAYWNRDRPDIVFGAWCSDGLFSGGASGIISDSGGDPDGADDRDGSDFDHLYGIWHAAEDFYGCAYVLFSGGSQLCGRAGKSRQ